MRELVQPAVGSTDAPSPGEEWLPARRFNEGPAYASRRSDAMERLAGGRHKGLALDGVLSYAVTSAITDDVGEPRRWPAHIAGILKGFLSDVRRNRILPDVARQPTLRLREVDGGGTDHQVWVLTDTSRATVDAQLSRVIGNAPHAELEVGAPRRVRARSIPGRFLMYTRLFMRCAQPFRTDSFSRNHALARTALWAGDTAEQARALFRESRPAALFIYRDFTTEGNVLVQVAKERGIPTYTTQHAIHPEFRGPNERVGNIVFENTWSDTYVCWGEFSRRQMEARSASDASSRRLLVHTRPTSPEEQQLALAKDSGRLIQVEELIVSLMGLRQEAENLAVARATFEVARRRSYRVTVRPHPSLDQAKYGALVDRLATAYGVQATLNDSRASTQAAYSEHSLGVTGLTSTYYENLLFGVPVVFYDDGLQLVKSVPRVLPGVRSADEMEEQIRSIEAMSWAEWYALADPVCELVYSRPCLDFTERESMVELVRADAIGQLAGQ